MKTLLLVRHAKSSWDSPSLQDIDRPLNDRGKHDAPAMAKRLLKYDVVIDKFVSSPAKRAKRTAEYFMEVYDQKEKDLVLVPELYEASVQNFKSTVAMLDDKHKNVAIFSHNHGITEFANDLTEVTIDNMPTCSIFAVKSSAKSWSAFLEEKKEFWFFDFPKKDV